MTEIHDPHKINGPKHVYLQGIFKREIVKCISYVHQYSMDSERFKILKATSKKWLYSGLLLCVVW
jgi:hypothetical protein